MPAHRRSGRTAAVLALAALLALVPAAEAPAHKQGKAEPRIAAGLSGGQGLVRTLTVRLTDLDSKKPIRRAVVAATGAMSEPHAMTTPTVRLTGTGRGVYSGRLRLPMAGRWIFTIRVRGEKVIAAKGRLRATVEPRPAASGSGAGEMPHGDPQHLTPVGTTIEDDALRSADYAKMASLWIHSVSAMGWIIGVVALVVALGTPAGVLAEGARAKIADAYRRWGAWVHWALVPLIVGTGIYQMLYVTPFPLAYTPDDLDRLREIPYGPLYEAILLAKLALFAVLLVTATMTLARIVRTPAPALVYGNPHPRFFRTALSVLGVPGVVYLATIPLILGAAMALRYVHVLNHVAVVLEAG